MGPAVALDHLAERANHGRLVVFVGAGVSKDAGLPLWHELFEPLRTQAGPDALAHPVDVAQTYADLHGREALLEYVQRALGRVRLPGRLHRALARVPARVYFTTNYDCLLERALAENGARPRVRWRDDDAAGADFLDWRTVVKLHGCLSARASLVITRDDYDAYRSTHSRLAGLLQSHLGQYTFLCVGFSLTDLNFREIHETTYRTAGRSGLDGYALDAGAHVAERAAFWRDLGVQVVRFPDFTRQREFVDELAARTSSGPFAPPVHPSSPLDAPLEPAREPAGVASPWHEM